MPKVRSGHSPGWTIAKVVVSVALVVGAGAYLLRGSLSGSLVYDRTVDQVLTERAELTGEHLHVGGRLVAGSLHVIPQTTSHEFQISGTNGNVNVRYSGLWPDAATDDRELMVEGVLGEDGVLVADRVLARCPSRYKRRVD